MRIRNLRIVAALLWFALIAPTVLSAPAETASAPAAVSARDEDRDGKNLGPDLYRTERGKVHREKRAHDLKLGMPQLNYGTAWEPISVPRPLVPKFKEILARHWGEERGEHQVEAWVRTPRQIRNWRARLYEELLRETKVTRSSVVLILAGSNQPNGLHMEMIFLRALTKARYIVAALKAQHTDGQIDDALRKLDKMLDRREPISNAEHLRILGDVRVDGRPVNQHLRLSPGGTSDNQACGSVTGGGCHPYGRGLDYAVPYGGDIEKKIATTTQAKYRLDEIVRQIEKHRGGHPAHLKKLYRQLWDLLLFALGKANKQPHDDAAAIEAERNELLEMMWQHLLKMRQKKQMRMVGGEDQTERFLSAIEEYWQRWEIDPPGPVKVPREVAQGTAEHARDQARGLMAPGCSSAAAGCERGEAPESGLEKSLAAAADGRNGGIDLRSLELRYLSDKPGDEKRKVKYAFSGKPAEDFADQHLGGGLTAARQSSDAFFVWLSMRPEHFWVNLSPDEPDRIVNAKIGRTDVGRIMLQSDLRMKKTVGELIHPDTKLGKEYWKHLDGKCFSFRNWIVPGQARVYAKGGELYIVDAPLKVKSEADYLSTQGVNGAKDCRQNSQATEDRNEALYRKLILPRLQHAVNKAPEYAELRRIYLSRVAADWYRARDKQHRTTYGALIDSGDISRWRHSGGWRPRDTFDDYVDSYRNGEFKVKHETRKGNYVQTNTYIYGGVDWSKMNVQQLNRQDFEQLAPKLAAATQQAVDRRASVEGDQLWVGGSAPEKSPADNGGVPAWGYLGALGMALLLGTAAALKARRTT